MNNIRTDGTKRIRFSRRRNDDARFVADRCVVFTAHDENAMLDGYRDTVLCTVLRDPRSGSGHSQADLFYVGYTIAIPTTDSESVAETGLDGTDASWDGVVVDNEWARVVESVDAALLEIVADLYRRARATFGEHATRKLKAVLERMQQEE